MNSPLGAGLVEWYADAMFRRALLLAGFLLSRTVLLSQSPAPAANAAVPPLVVRPVDALHFAVRAGNLPEVERLVNRGVDVNARDALGSTPLLDATWGGNLDIASFLLSRGADPNAIHTEAGATALEYAVLSSRAALVKVLLAAGARVDMRYRDGQSVLHLAAARGNMTVLTLLLDAHAAVGAADTNGNTPLDAAILQSQREAAILLIGKGADVKRVHPGDGRGPLHEACMKGVAGLVQPLVDAGADPTQRDLSGQTPLDLALAYKNSGAIAALLASGRKLKESSSAAGEAMETATVRGQTVLVRLLLDGGFDVNQPTAAGSSYLNDAALKGKKEVVQLLLDRGARIAAHNAEGGTPLHDAALGGSTEVIALLLDHGADVNSRERQSGATALMLAASLGRVDAIRLLLERGADPSLRDKTGRSALERAKETENTAAIRLLVAAAGGQPIGSLPHLL